MKKYLPWIVYAFSFLAFSYTLYSLIKVATTFQPDFSIFYYAARDVLHGITPYNDKTLFTAFNYPVATTIFFMPFTFFSFKISQSIFTITNAVALFSAILFTYKSLQKKIVVWQFLVVASFALLAFPTKFTFGMGQTNLIAYALLLAGFFLFSKTKRIKSAFLFFLCAMLLKPILFFTLLVFLFEKQYTYFFSLCIAIAFFVFLIPILFHLPNSNVIFLQNILHQSLAGREVYYNQGFLGFIARLTNNLALRTIVTTGITVPLLFFVFWKIRSISFVSKLSLLLTTLLLIDPLSWQHHFVFLLLPFLLTYFLVTKQKLHQKFYLLLFVMSYLFVAWNFKTPQIFQSFPLILSNQLYGTILLLFLQLKLL
ncbi:MAG TPA: glycosyltransferase 87 family protein [Patescibacteria group bacterium]|nr:glycosyltransferase 87 family protein [Patescibacteria group bacterium]